MGGMQVQTAKLNHYRPKQPGDLLLLVDEWLTGESEAGRWDPPVTE